MDKNNLVTKFIQPVYELTVSRVWRGHGSVFFMELGKLSKDGKKGEYTLWIDTCRWKLNRDGKVIDGNEEPYDVIDTEVEKLVGLKISKIEFDTPSKRLHVFFDDDSLECVPTDEFFASLILNEHTKYLNFEVDGTTSFSDGKS